MANFKDLSNLLTTLFQKLPFPIGGEEPEAKLIWMTEHDNTIIATVTKRGYTVVTSEGLCNTTEKIEEVESMFLTFFKMRGLGTMMNLIK